MSFTQDELVGTVGVLAILIGVIVYGNLRAARKAKASPDPVPGFVGRFAVYQGAVVGRIVAEENGILVLEQSGSRSTVPSSAARVEGNDVALSQAPEVKP